MATVFQLPEKEEILMLYAVGEQTDMSGVYSAKLNENIPVSYHLGCKDDADAWYDLARNETNQYFLRVIDRFDSGSYNVIVTEHVDDTLYTWVNKKQTDLLACAPSIGLNREFQIILSDIINGFDHLRSKHGREHGNISTSSIFIVNGRAKLGWFADLKSKQIVKRGNDVVSFVNLITWSFKVKGEGVSMPEDLVHLCKGLKAVMENPDRYLLMCKCVFHPALLTAEQRFWYCHEAYLEVGRRGEPIRGVLKFELAAAFPNCNWTGAVVEDSYKNILHHKQDGQSQFAPVYNSDALSFWAFCRNVYEHKHKHHVVGSAEVVDATLASFLPGFMGFLHMFLVSLGILVKPPSNLSDWWCS